MDSSTSWPAGLTDRLGPLRVVSALGPRVDRVRAGEVELVVKRGPAVGDEAAGLERLAQVAGGPRVPAVLYCDGSFLAVEWIPTGPSRASSEEALGRALAVLHSDSAGEWGGGSSWIGECRVDPTPRPSAAEFYADRLADLARRCGLSAVVGAVVDRLDSLVPPARPAPLHGDLWWGNVLWGADGRPALIDPSVHGGHPEEDLAMLALFGAIPRRLLDGYTEARALDEGWQERVALWQLYPLLVHTVLFGGSYRSRAEAVARRYG